MQVVDFEIKIYALYLNYVVFIYGRTSIVFYGEKYVEVILMKKTFSLIISYIYSPSVELYRYGMRHTVYVSMQGICHNTIIRNTTVQFVIDT
jgi:hypothetical protein